MNGWITGILILVLTLIGVGAFALLVKIGVLVRRQSCPRCGISEEVPSMFLTCRCKACDCEFDLLVGQVHYPRSRIKKIFDFFFGSIGHVFVFAMNLSVLAFIYSEITKNLWIIGLVAFLLLVPLSIPNRKSRLRYAFGDQQANGSIQQNVGDNPIYVPGEER